MSYAIEQKLISFNRPGTPLKPQGWVIHDTEDIGATANDIRGWFNQQHAAGQGSSTTFVADWGQILQLIPDDEKCWGAGPTANGKYLQLEICVPATHDPERFQAVWDRAVWLTAMKCVQYGWSIMQIFSHGDISRMYGETTHLDPDRFFMEYGKSMAHYKAEVQNWINKLNGVSPSTPVQQSTGYVAQLQTLCNKYGYKDMNGRALVVDNSFGPKTLSAVPTVRRGSDLHDFVKLIQTIVKVTPDGAYGKAPYHETYDAVINFQRTHSLDADGIVGKLTWTALMK